MTTFTFNNGHAMAWYDGKLHTVYVRDGVLVHTIDGVEQPAITGNKVTSACIMADSGGVSVVYAATNGSLWFAHWGGRWTTDYCVDTQPCVQPAHRTDEESVVITFHRADGYVYVAEVHGDGNWTTTQVGPGCFSSIAPTKNVIYFRSERQKAGVWKLIRAERQADGTWKETETGLTGHDPSVCHTADGIEWVGFQHMANVYVYAMHQGVYYQDKKFEGYGWFAHLRSYGNALACCWEASSVTDVKINAAKWTGLAYVLPDGDTWTVVSDMTTLGVIYGTCELSAGRLDTAAVRSDGSIYTTTRKVV